MNQGQSLHTLRKEQGLHGHLKINLGVAKRMPQFLYHHFDINAGCGFNHKVGCEGSPLVFIRTAEEIGCTNYVAHFVDRDKTAIVELLGRISDERSTIYHGDNREFVKAIPDLIAINRERPAKALGSIFCDPNGTDVPISELGELVHVCPRLDIILNYPARVWMRERGAGHYDEESFLHNIIQRLNKTCWLIQSSAPSDPNDWMILIGRNWKPRNAWEAMGFFYLDSAAGRQCLKRTLSRNESTLRLFD